jgi:hypothetical protein
MNLRVEAIQELPDSPLTLYLGNKKETVSVRPLGNGGDFRITVKRSRKHFPAPENIEVIGKKLFVGDSNNQKRRVYVQCSIRDRVDISMYDDVENKRVYLNFEHKLIKMGVADTHASFWYLIEQNNKKTAIAGTYFSEERI